jgi:hypothetical protein
MSRKARFKPTLADFADRSPEPLADESWTWCVVEARAGGVFCTIQMSTSPSYRAARTAAERAQELADEQCLPQRAYVLDAAGIPVYVASISEIGQERALEQRQSIANCHDRR